jgi:hypothetical protein
LLAWPVVLAPSLAVAATFGEVIGWCATPRLEGDDKLCSGYVTAALALLRSADSVLNGGHRVCAPEGEATKALVPILASWSKQHPEARDQDAVTTIGDALVSRYPCP